MAGTKGVLELFDFVLPKREDTCAYCVRDDAFAAELDTVFIQGTTERQARAPLDQPVCVGETCKASVTAGTLARCHRGWWRRAGWRP